MVTFLNQNSQKQKSFISSNLNYPLKEIQCFEARKIDVEYIILIFNWILWDICELRKIIR